jgi:hypothetical protein
MEPSPVPAFITLMDNQKALHDRLTARDTGISRLRRLTRAAALAMTALAGIFAGLAAAKAPARRAAAVPTQVSSSRVTVQQAAPIPPPPTLPPLSADPNAQPAPAPAVPTSQTPATPAPAPPSQPPQATAAPPVSVSGGS